ncbi:MAG TPA: hypothetical protein VGE77_00575 [Nocardioides sp.]
MRRTVRGMRRARTAGAVAAALVLTLAACSDGSDGDDDGATGDDPSESADPDEATSGAEPTDAATSDPPEDLPQVDPEFGFTAGGVCRGESTIPAAQPYPGDPSGLSAMLLLESMPFPDLATDEPYVPVSTSYPWDAEPQADLGNVNAIVCMTVVPESVEVRKVCDTPVYPELQPDAWEVWTGDYVVSVVDPTTAEVLAEGEPFSSADFLPVADVGCEVTAPVGNTDGAYGYSSDLPTIRYWGSEVEEVVALLG